MNDNSHNNSLISKKSSSAVLQKDKLTPTNSRPSDDEPNPSRSTYESFYWLFSYTSMFTTRLAKDLFISLLSYCYNDSGVLQPDHIVDLMRVQKSLRAERESHTITYKLSDSFLDVHIPSYPGSARSLVIGSRTSLHSMDERNPNFRKAIDFLHQDHEFLIAAETGDEDLLQTIISKGTDIQQRDHLGRNALHLAVCFDNVRIIKMLLKLGVNPNIKDSVGMTPLSLSLMRRPSLKVAKLLFEYGAVILTRYTPMDTGLFIQFVMMSVPTREEEKILYLLVEKGALVNDPEAPGGRHALHFAAMSNNCELIEILVDLGADLYVTNHRNETPKDVALTFKCKEAYDLLDELEESPSMASSGHSKQSALSHTTT